MPPAPSPVYLRTMSGWAELAERRRALSPTARRLLALVDGQRSLADLERCSRPAELPAAIGELASQGLVVLLGHAARREPPPDGARRLAALKRGLQGLAQAELGADGLVIDARLQDAIDEPLLRRVLREAIEQVRQRAGEDAARRIASRVRHLLAAEPPAAGGQGRGASL